MSVNIVQTTKLAGYFIPTSILYNIKSVDFPPFVWTINSLKTNMLRVIEQAQ